jgi:hypothetical protein
MYSPGRIFQTNRDAETHFKGYYLNTYEHKKSAIQGAVIFYLNRLIYGGTNASTVLCMQSHGKLKSFFFSTDKRTVFGVALQKASHTKAVYVLV